MYSLYMLVHVNLYFPTLRSLDRRTVTLNITGHMFNAAELGLRICRLSVNKYLNQRDNIQLQIDTF